MLNEVKHLANVSCKSLREILPTLCFVRMTLNAGRNTFLDNYYIISKNNLIINHINN